MPMLPLVKAPQSAMMLSPTQTQVSEEFFFVDSGIVLHTVTVLPPSFFMIS